MLAALVKLDASLAASQSKAKLLVVITGKGPQKAMYEEQIRNLAMRHVAVITAWLEAGDYPKLLGCADLGVCLHTSSSGLDLPMKVVDMFGCALPVCAVNFSCLHELVQHGRNGFVFSTANELAAQLESLFSRSPDGGPTLSAMRQQLASFARWSDNWKDNALPLIRRCLSNQ